MPTGTEDVPINFKRGEIIIEDGSPTPYSVIFDKTEGNFTWTPGDVEEIDVMTRGVVDSVLSGKEGPTTFSFNGWFNGCKNASLPNEPKPYEFVGTGLLPGDWVKADARIDRPNYNVRFRMYDLDGVTVKAELLFPGSTIRGNVKEGQINEISLTGRCPRKPFPTIVK